MKDMILSDDVVLKAGFKQNMNHYRNDENKA